MRRDREVALVEQAAHDGADLSGGADDRDVQTLMSLSRPRPAVHDGLGVRGVQVERRVHGAHRVVERVGAGDHGDADLRGRDHLDVDAGARDSAANSFADTPGCDFMPAPTSESLPIVSSYCSDSKPMSGWSAVSADVARAPSARGQRERDVRQARGGGRHVLHDHVDVHAGAGDDLEDACGLARHVGHADDRDLGLAAVVRDAGDDRLFQSLLRRRAGRSRTCPYAW